MSKRKTLITGIELYNAMKEWNSNEIAKYTLYLLEDYFKDMPMELPNTLINLICENGKRGEGWHKRVQRAEAINRYYDRVAMG